MAFFHKNLSGGMGGSGKASNVFTYVTNDAIATITTDGYMDSLGGGLEIGDVVYAIELAATTPKVHILVCSTAEYVDGSGFVTSLDPIGTFTGDTRGTDDAGYERRNHGGNIGAGGSHMMSTYRNNTDTSSAIAGAGYFNDVVFFEINDIVLIVANDAFEFGRVFSTTAGAVKITHIAFV